MRTTLIFTKAALQGIGIGFVIYLVGSTGWLVGHSLQQHVVNSAETIQEIY